MDDLIEKIRELSEQIGEIRGERRGRREVKRKMSINLAKMGVPITQIAEAAGVKAKTVQKWVTDSKKNRMK